MECRTLAGLPIVDLAEEPVAAAVHYGAHASVGGEKTILVYDLGGGTFDATILHVAPDGLYARATSGVSNLGGKNFDEAIMAIIAEQYRQTHHFDPLSDRVCEGQLRRHAEAMKIKLSLPNKSETRTSLLVGGRTLELLLTRRQFELATQNLVARSMEVCEETLQAAGLTWSKIDRIIMCGGSSLLPCVRAALQHVSGKPGDRIEMRQPHTAVAYGAALIAANRDRGLGGNCFSSEAAYCRL